MNDELDQLLSALKLKRLREMMPAALRQTTDAQPSYEDFLLPMLREQYRYQQERALNYRIEQARLPECWTLESFPFERQPAVHAPTIRQLAALDWVSASENLVFIGPTGVGKSGLAMGLLRKALQNGYRGRFVKAQDLFDEMYQSLAHQGTRKLLKQLVTFDVLVIDELGYLTLRQEQHNIFFKLVEERYTHRKASIITTNLDFDDWYSFLGARPMVDAMLDRLRHRCQTLRFEGPSLRVPTVRS
jgi:DNA replication protein DnaC